MNRNLELHKRTTKTGCYHTVIFNRFIQGAVKRVEWLITEAEYKRGQEVINQDEAAIDWFCQCL